MLEIDGNCQSPVVDCLFVLSIAQKCCIALLLPSCSPGANCAKFVKLFVFVVAVLL
jgi:hypothetical protein